MPNEYISRDALLQDIQDTIDNSGCVNHESEIIDCVRYAMPAADVAPVVRCKDCRYFGAAQTYLCNMHHRAANVEDYCSYGIRMDGGEPNAE